MNKNILAIAIATAVVAAPSAFAKSTVYGQAHMSANSIDDGTDSTTSVASNSSRLGVKGSEDLGAGLKAVFQYETTVNWDGAEESIKANTSEGDDQTITYKSGGLGGQRNTFAGIAGGFGTVLMGIHDTPYKLVGRQFDYFGDQIGDSRTLTNIKPGKQSWDLRTPNVVAYKTPTMGGFEALAAYVVDESKEAADNKDAFSVSGNFKAGKLNLGAAYENHGKGWDTVSANAYRLGAGYDFGAFTVKASYSAQEYGNTGKAITTNVYGLGAGVKVGAAGTVKAQYYVLDDVNNVDNTGATLTAVGYDHAMSKSTKAYVAYSVTNNESASKIGVGTTGGFGQGLPAATNGKDPAAFSVGLIHKF